MVQLSMSMKGSAAHIRVCRRRGSSKPTGRSRSLWSRFMGGFPDALSKCVPKQTQYVRRTVWSELEHAATRQRFGAADTGLISRLPTLFFKIDSAG
mmetsp:Transcript_29515/g.46301  ORF Transcript_29515/g.46301 Transcript_29515/m.46301 type:complete len:96 (-) Transcript_29515:542-829(-)